MLIWVVFYFLLVCIFFGTTQFPFIISLLVSFSVCIIIDIIQWTYFKSNERIVFWRSLYITPSSFSLLMSLPSAVYNVSVSGYINRFTFILHVRVKEWIIASLYFASLFKSYFFFTSFTFLSSCCLLNINFSVLSYSCLATLYDSPFLLPFSVPHCTYSRSLFLLCVFLCKVP